MEFLSDLLEGLSWWHWGVLGLGLILSELLLPMFVLVWFGLGALLVMVAVLVLPGLSVTVQLLAWTVLSLAMVALWFKVFRRDAHKVLTGRASAQLEGEMGLLTENVAPFHKGKVRFQKPFLGTDQWECLSDETLEAGTRVRVIRVEGSLVTVGKAIPRGGEKA